MRLKLFLEKYNDTFPRTKSGSNFFLSFTQKNPWRLGFRFRLRPSQLIKVSFFFPVSPAFAAVVVHAWAKFQSFKLKKEVDLVTKITAFLDRKAFRYLNLACLEIGKLMRRNGEHLVQYIAHNGMNTCDIRFATQKRKLNL